ncbi:hypothetical protein [Bacillus massilinigeriensis]|uniref:hypothetical protein n=1 Tax=Bacillus mediterraneensis TaxID=1805474 RepID=UPI0008F84BB8|nr:hypothetical protein [Bacillus mediterraneensis]
MDYSPRVFGEMADVLGAVKAVRTVRMSINANLDPESHAINYNGAGKAEPLNASELYPPALIAKTSCELRYFSELWF